MSEIEIVPTEEIVETQVPVYTVGESTCDNYLATLSCIANAMSDSESDELSRTIDSVYQSFTDVPVDQLIETCTILSQALRSHPTMLQEYAECNMLVDIVE